MPLAPEYFTADMVRAIPDDGKRYELVWGELLVTPASVKDLLLVAEVLSPATARRDRFQKRKLYQAQGVGMLWLVDPVRMVVEVWTPDAGRSRRSSRIGSPGIHAERTSHW